MNILFGNYGDNTIALLQWANEHQVDIAYVVNIDTGWSAPAWQTRIEQARNLVVQYGWQPKTLAPSESFSKQVIARGSFPSVQFQWCPLFLKGMPFLEFLDEVDPACEATIILGSRRADSRARIDLSEYIETSEHYDGRRVWYPLYLCDDASRHESIKKTGFELLNGRSLECYPCVHSSIAEYQAMDQASRTRLLELEAQVNQKFVPQTSRGNKSLEVFDLGCGSPFVCGE